MATEIFRDKQVFKRGICQQDHFERRYLGDRQSSGWILNSVLQHLATIVSETGRIQLQLIPARWHRHRVKTRIREPVSLPLRQRELDITFKFVQPKVFQGFGKRKRGEAARERIAIRISE